MGNCFGKMDAPASRASTPTPPAVSAPAVLAPVVQSDPFPLNQLERDLKELIAKCAGPETNKVLRLTNKSFRQAGATHLTKLAVPASELGRLSNMLASLPGVIEVTITGLRRGVDAHLKALSQLDPDVLAKIRRLNLSDSDVTNAGIAHLQPLTQLQSLDLHSCRDLTDASLLYLQPLTHLQSLDLNSCYKFTDAGLAHVQPLTHLQSLTLNFGFNFTDAGLDNLQPLTLLQSLNLYGCDRVTDAALQRFPFAIH